MVKGSNPSSSSQPSRSEAWSVCLASFSGNHLATSCPRVRLPGSAVIYKRGKSWRVIVYLGRDPMTGKQLRKSGSAPTRAAAKLLEARLVTEAAAGQYRGDRKRTVAELLDRWFEWRQGVRPISPRTVDNNRRDMDWFILPVLGKRPVARLDAATLDRFYAQLGKQGGKNGQPLAPQHRPRGSRHSLGCASAGHCLGLDHPEPGPARLSTRR